MLPLLLPILPPRIVSSPLATILILTLALAGLATAAPPTSKVEIAPRCGTTYYPTIIQQLVENDPTTVGVNTVSTTSTFHVSRLLNIDTGISSNRVTTFVAFQNIPPGSYGCQLSISMPALYSGLIVHPPMLNHLVDMNVSSVFVGSPSSIVYPNAFSWNTYTSPQSQNYMWPHRGPGLFGTVTAVPGETQVVNSAVCQTNMAFLFEIAEWTPFSASVNFEQGRSVNGTGDVVGVYLTANC